MAEQGRRQNGQWNTVSREPASTDALSTGTVVINLTPHAVTFVVGDEQVTIQPSGEVARVQSRDEPTGVRIEIAPGIEVDVVKTVFGTIEGLPDPQDGVVYPTSLLVAQAAKRPGVFAPGMQVRDSEGRVIGAKALTTTV